MKNARIEVRDKKSIYDAVAEGLKIDIKDLGIKSVKDIEYVQVYTVQGDFLERQLKKIAEEVLTDKISQEYSYKNGFGAVKSRNSRIVEIAYNPGVMDPVEESAMKACKDLGIKNVDSISTSKKYILKGNIIASDFEKIRDRLLYNKVIQHVVSGNPQKKTKTPSHAFGRVEVDIISASDKELKKLSIRGQLYLSLVEMKAIKDYFKKLKRNPTDCELETLAQTWSEHCKHKTMMGAVNFNGRKFKNLLKETVMKVTTDLDKSWCVSVFKDNAGIIKFDSKHNICFKVETHNHPSALEPYGGAETGIGGVIRDPMGTGLGSKPIINTDVFCFGKPNVSSGSVPRGALHPKRVLKGVVSGVRDYGNKMGIPTVNGSVCFDERYTGNPLVFCGNVGIMPKECSFNKVSTGDLIVAVGGRTGRDGIHGATFSSAELTHESETISGTAVQIGNPITEKKVLDTLLKARDKGLYDAITDCGAGGFSSAVGEMGELIGAEVYLEKAPLKYDGLKPWEIWISEAQERMVLAVKPKKVKALLNIFEMENVEATVIGKFTNTKKLCLFYKDNKVTDLDMSFIHDGLPKVPREAYWKKDNEKKESLPAKKKNLNGDLLKVLSTWNVCSKEWIIRQYDHEVQGGSVLKPLIGVENDGPSDASITRPFLDSHKGIVLSNGINPNYGELNPYWMAASAIDEALRQIVATGGDIEKTALLDNFCWGNTDKPRQLGSLVRASQACYDIAKAFGTPFISGKDSLNNEFNAGKKTVSIPPTLLISAISVMPDVRKSISSDVKEAGNVLYVVGKTYNELGGSQYFVVSRKKGGYVPKVRIDAAIKTMKRLTAAIKNGYINSAHDCSEGGIAVCVSEMLFSGGMGADISLKGVSIEKGINRDEIIMFSESNSRFIVEVAPGKEKEFKKFMRGIDLSRIGTVTESKKLMVRGVKGKPVVNVDIDKLKETWKKPFKRLMHEEG